MSLKLPLLVACAALVLCGQPARKIFPYEYAQEDLPNGLRLITVPTDYANIVAVYIVVQTGSRNEVEPGLTGFAHLFEHLMFRCTSIVAVQMTRVLPSSIRHEPSAVEMKSGTMFTGRICSGARLSERKTMLVASGQ